MQIRIGKTPREDASCVRSSRIPQRVVPLTGEWPALASQMQWDNHRCKPTWTVAGLPRIPIESQCRVEQRQTARRRSRGVLRKNGWYLGKGRPSFTPKREPLLGLTLRSKDRQPPAPVPFSCRPDHSVHALHSEQFYGYGTAVRAIRVIKH